MAKRKKKQQTPKGVICLIAFICIVCLVYEPLERYFSDNREKITEVVEDVKKEYEEAKKARLELPAALTDRPELILERRGYTTSYNKELKIPNWVAWELTPEKLIERESRTDKFLPDPDLPESEAVTTDDYKRSGYDRGHMCQQATIAGTGKRCWRAST